MKIWAAILFVMFMLGLLFNQKLHEGRLLRRIDELKASNTTANQQREWTGQYLASVLQTLRTNNVIIPRSIGTNWSLNAQALNETQVVVTYTMP